LEGRTELGQTERGTASVCGCRSDTWNEHHVGRNRVGASTLCVGRSRQQKRL